MSDSHSFYSSLVEMEILGRPDFEELSDDALLNACSEVAVYTIPLPDGLREVDPLSISVFEFLQRVQQVAWDALSRLRVKRGIVVTNTDVDESIVASVRHLVDEDEEFLCQLGTPALNLGRTEWRWSLYNELICEWGISYSSSTESYVLWVKPLDPDALSAFDREDDEECEDDEEGWKVEEAEEEPVAVALLPATDLSEERAAVHLMIAHFRRDAAIGDLDPFHSVEVGEYDNLTYDDYRLIKKAVWRKKDGDSSTLKVDQVRVAAIARQALQDRLDSLSRP